MLGIEHKKFEVFFQRQYRFFLGMDAHETNREMLQHFIFCNLRVPVNWNLDECLPHLGWQLLELIWRYLAPRKVAADNVCYSITIVSRSRWIVPDPEIKTAGSAHRHNPAKDPIIPDRPRGQAREGNHKEYQRRFRSFHSAAEQKKCRIQEDQRRCLATERHQDACAQPGR